MMPAHSDHNNEDAQCLPKHVFGLAEHRLLTQWWMIHDDDDDDGDDDDGDEEWMT